MVYRANEAEFILLHICSIERGTNQSLHSDYANKLIDISKRETTVSNRFSGLYYICHKKASFILYKAEEAGLHLLHKCARDGSGSMSVQYASGARHSTTCDVYLMTIQARHTTLKG
jgi:hypothetical protein